MSELSEGAKRDLLNDIRRCRDEGTPPVKTVTTSIL
jgi:hypothetical protein